MELHQLSLCYWIFSQVHVKSKETCSDSTQFCSVAQWSIKRFCWVTDTRIIRKLESEFSLFTVAAVVFPKSVYLNIKSTRTVVIQNNYKKRFFAIYPKTKKGWFSERETQRQVIKGMFCLHAGRWQHTSSCTIPMTDSTDGKWKYFLPWLCYKRNGKRCSCAAIELWIHLGGLLSTQEARVALG